MKTISVFILTLVCIIFSKCILSEQGPKSFTFQGKIIGQDTGKITLQYGLFSTYHKDVASISHGNFTFKGMIEEPTRAWIDGGNELNKTEIYLEPGDISATLIKDKFKEIVLKGSKTQEELVKLNKQLESIKNQDSVLLIFVSKNPKSFLTPYYLQSLDATQAIPPNTLKTIFAGLDASVQNSRYGRVALGIIRKFENTHEGAAASDFKAIDIKNQTIKLSQFKGENFVLLDFWNSTCGPCRKGMPHLISLYNQYHSKSLEIIAVDCYDTNKDAWISAINQDSTKMFYHVPTFFQTGAIINEEIILDYPVYSVQGIPQTILINKDGIVIGFWGGYSKENDDSLDKKLAEIFKN